MNNIYEAVIETPENDFTEDIFASNDDKQKIMDVINCVKDVRYGFIDKNTGEIHDDRDWIHNCDCLSKYYQTNFDPKITLKNKLGICLDSLFSLNVLNIQ